MNSKRIRNGAIYLAIVAIVGFVLYTTLTRQANSNSPDVSIDIVAEQVRSGNVTQILIDEDRITAIDKSGARTQSRKEESTSLIETLSNLGVSTAQLQKVDIKVEMPQWWESWGNIALTLLPLILLGVFFVIILRQAQGAGNQAFGFGKSRARMFTGDRPTVTFNDVAGNDEAKQELSEVVEFLKEPEKFQSLGARIPGAFYWWGRLARARH